jgi:lipoteichoic acid synthase
MNPKSIFSGTGDAVGGFAGNIFNAIKGNILILIALFLPAVLIFILNRKTALMEHQAKGRYRILALLLSASLIIAEAVGMNNDQRSRNQAGADYEFNSAVPAFGLINALAIDTYHLCAGSSASGALTISTPESSAVTTPTVYGVNELDDVDFNQLAESTDNQALQQLDQYVASKTASRQNEYTGIFKGKNLILIAAESFATGIIDPEITPTLYRLANKGIVFNDYYQPAWGGSTTTGEYSILTGLVPTDGVNSMKATIGHDLSTTIGNQLKQLNYFTRAYHDNTDTYYSRNLTHENFGYEKFIGYGNGMEEGLNWSWPCSDDEMMQWTVPQYIDEQPFSIYYMTVSGHAAYTEESDAMAVKNLQYLRDTYPSFNEHSEKVQCYLAANYELEKGLTYLLDQLEEQGILDDTVICLTADHYPYGLEKSAAWDNDVSYLDELYGYPVEAYNQQERDKNTLIIWSGCIEDQHIEVDDPVSSIDIVPTLANLFGTDFDSRLYNGRDVFSDASPLVMWIDRSWKTDLGVYNAGTDVFTPNEGVSEDDIPEGYVEQIQNRVRNEFTFSQSVLENDYYAHVYSND